MMRKRDMPGRKDHAFFPGLNLVAVATGHTKKAIRGVDDVSFGGRNLTFKPPASD